MSALDDVKAEERKYLREEHENNRKFVFERPLIIAGAILAALLNSKTPATEWGLLVPLVLAILYYNVSFTHNRLASSSRIVAFLKLFHESDEYVGYWKPWETALSLQRAMFVAGNAPENKDATDNSSRGRRGRKSSNGDSLQFYPAIFWFHVFIAVFTVVLALVENPITQYLFEWHHGSVVIKHLFSLASLGSWGMVVLDLASIGLFLHRVYTPLGEVNLRSRVNRQELLWKAALNIPDASGAPTVADAPIEPAQVGSLGLAVVATDAVSVERRAVEQTTSIA
jgi:hypothetical protein